MKSLGEGCIYGVRLGLFLLILLPIITQSQTSVSNDLPDAVQLAKIIKDFQETHPEAPRMDFARALGFQLISVSRFSDAADLFAAILQKAPHDQQASYGAALALFNLKQLKQAEQLARSALEAAKQQGAVAQPPEASNWRSRESDSLVLLGVILAVKGDNAGALTAVSKAVVLTPESFDAQFAFGRALYGAGDLSNAAAAFRKAITLRSQDSQSRFFLATALEGAGDYEQAREVYQELIRMQPQQAEGHLGLGVLLLKQANNSADAIRELTEAVKLKGDLYEARIALGRALISAGRPAEAIEHLERAALLIPGNPEPHYQLAIAYRRLGKTEAAALEAAKVKEINSLRRGGNVTSNSKSNPDNPN
jgi:tetratricopeptide (TPR) repeat protein